MASKHSFDITGKIDLQEVDNATNQALRDVSHRYDLKDSEHAIEFSAKDCSLTVEAEDDYKLKAIQDILNQSLIKRGISIDSVSYDEVHTNLSKASVKGTIQQGIPQDNAKKMIKAIKDQKFKVAAQINDDCVRVIGKNRDDLQAVMQYLKTQSFDCYFGFGNYR
jgi:hypothetical protein